MKHKQPLYSLPSNILFLMKQVWQIDKTLLFATILQVPVIVIMPLLGTYLSKYVVELVTQNASPIKLLTYIIGISMAMLYTFSNVSFQYPGADETLNLR